MALGTFGLSGTEDFHHAQANQAARNLNIGMAEWRTHKHAATRREIAVRLAFLAGRALAHVESSQDPDIALKTHLMSVVRELEQG